MSAHVDSPPSGLTERVLSDTHRWLERAVIGLNLCPFARGVMTKGQVHMAVSMATDTQGLLEDLQAQLQELADASPDQRDTTLLVVPCVLGDFLDFNFFLADAQALLARLGLVGEFQLASFHPHYQFADTAPDDVSNCSNRAPYATLHLLRESSLSRVIDAHPDPDGIYLDNIRRLRALGAEGWRKLDVGASQPDAGTAP